MSGPFGCSQWMYATGIPRTGARGVFGGGIATDTELRRRRRVKHVGKSPRSSERQRCTKTSPEIGSASDAPRTVWWSAQAVASR